MDNVFEILIYAIIIISFLSSFFKKKKKVPKSNQEELQDEVDDFQPKKSEPVIAQKKEVDDYDILREIEKMFKMETPEQPVAVPKKVEPIRRSQPVLKTETRKVASEHVATQSEHVYSKSISYDSKAYKPIQKVKSLEDEEKYFPMSKPVINPFTDLKRKLRDPQTVRDFIIISEIIGKPKALKR